MSVSRLSEAGEAYLALLHLNRAKANRVRSCINRYSFPSNRSLCDVLNWTAFRISELAKSLLGIDEWNVLINMLGSEIENRFSSREITLPDRRTYVYGYVRTILNSVYYAIESPAMNSLDLDLILQNLALRSESAAQEDINTETSEDSDDDLEILNFFDRGINEVGDSDSDSDFSVHEEIKRSWQEQRARGYSYYEERVLRDYERQFQLEFGSSSDED